MGLMLIPGQKVKYLSSDAFHWFQWALDRALDQQKWTLDFPQTGERQWGDRSFCNVATAKKPYASPTSKGDVKAGGAKEMSCTDSCKTNIPVPTGDEATFEPKSLPAITVLQCCYCTIPAVRWRGPKRILERNFIEMRGKNPDNWKIC